MQIAEPALTPAMAPLGREYYQIQRPRPFDLDPALAARSGSVFRVDRLGHDPFMPVSQSLLQEFSGDVLVRRGGMRDQRMRRDFGQQREAPRLRFIEQRRAVPVEQI